MNKKLFFAGFALLAAVSFTSCNSDNPIDITNPNGVTPAAATHYVGGEYDWTAIVANYDDLKKFWAEDGKKVADLLKDNKDKTADILIDVTGYELKATDGANGDGYLMIPDFWAANGGTATANGKVVNITFVGNFKNADFERANAIEKGDNAAKMSKFPVRINTDKLKGAEVNFTFNVEKFDLYLTSELTRSTFSGSYTIGYMKAQTATKLSALEVKEGTVEGLDVESTGDYKGTFGGAWTKTDLNFITVNGSGIKFLNGNTISGAKNLFVEEDAILQTWYNPGSGTTDYKLGVVKFVKKAATLNMGFGPRPYSIESIEGIEAKSSFIDAAATAFGKVESVKNVTINNGAALTLDKDIFTDVTFDNPVTINTKEISSLDKLTFNNTTTIEVADDNQTLAFNGVNFANVPVYMRSGMSIEHTTAFTLYDYYQWVVSNEGASKGKWVMYKTDNGYAIPDADKVIKEYNKDKEVVEYSDQDVYIDGNDQLKNKDGKKPDLTKATHLIKIGHYYKAGTIEVIPEGTKLVLDGNCTFAGAKTDDALNGAFGYVTDLKNTWYDVTYGDKAYNWRRIQIGGTYVWWALVPAAE